MTLQGWTRPLPTYLVEAIKAGKITVHKAKDYEYLVGEIINPQGTLISFQENTPRKPK